MKSFFNLFRNVSWLRELLSVLCFAAGIGLFASVDFSGLDLGSPFEDGLLAVSIVA